VKLSREGASMHVGRKRRNLHGKEKSRRWVWRLDPRKKTGGRKERSNAPPHSEGSMPTKEEDHRRKRERRNSRRKIGTPEISVGTSEGKERRGQSDTSIREFERPRERKMLGRATPLRKERLPWGEKNPSKGRKASVVCEGEPKKGDFVRKTTK